MKESPAKVQAKISELNRGSSLGTWVPATGFHALTSFEYGVGSKDNTFNPASGLIVKAFVNTKTGEVKTYAAEFFTETV